MQTHAPPHWERSAQKDDRRRFLRTALQDAQAELNHLDSPLKVMESALLTAMGMLGVGWGFNGMGDPEADGITVIGRGMEDAVLDGIQANFPTLVDRYAPSLDASPYPLRSRIICLPSGDEPPDCLKSAKIRILAGWRMGARVAGLMGLSDNLRDVPFLECEIDFLYRLMDQMMAAFRTIEANSVIHTLNNELDQARQQAVENAVRGENARKALEETLFRLSGFHDIFQELSGLQDSVKVLDAFLLVMLGIFSAQSGTILYHDSTLLKAHVAMRGSAAGSAPPYTVADVREMIATVYKSLPGGRLGAMQAAAVPIEPLKRTDLIASDSTIGVIFSVNPNISGLLCLGQRLVDTQYGHHEQDMLLAFTHTFLALLKNSASFETIQQLHANQKQKTTELEKTVQALTESRRIISSLEKAGERIKAAIAGAMARSTRVSILDIVLIIIAGTILGLVYNLASPSGISVVPQIWQYPPSPKIDVATTRALLQAGTIILVDARPAEFHKQRHIRGALNLPLALFDFVYMMRFGRIDPQTPIVVYGRNISRHYDEEIAHQLRQRGHPKVSVLTGGVDAWPTEEVTVTP